VIGLEGLVKKAIFVSFAVSVLAMGAASAADILVYKGPLPPAFYNWSGCFIGVAAGGNWGQSKHVSGGPLAPGRDITNWYNISGGIAGGTWGCNIQLAPWVVIGTESDSLGPTSNPRQRKSRRL
jgi:outer membrane immunogenic protein